VRVELTDHFRSQGLANLCLSRSAYPPAGQIISELFHTRDIIHPKAHFHIGPTLRKEGKMKRKIVPVLLLVLFVVVLPLTLAFGMYLKSGQPCPIDIERLETCVAVAYIVAIIVLLLRMIFKKDRK
jgi:hypothetical protein